ncbi:hypothetical protein BC332_21366 [Capsicum chinense]|nr:hypothetical protein BC332_21366 [Capsicum chinense]
MPEGLDTTAKEHQGRTIPPDAGVLHILALLKRGSWLLVKEKIETMILVPNDEANISKNRSEDEPVISNKRIWEKNFKFTPEMLQIVPLWVTLLGLQVYYWSKENLSRIASKIGKPICANRLTAEIERNSFMRLFIEVDVTQALPTEIYIEEEGSIRTQQVDYDWHPIACPDCEKWDHEQGPDGKSATSEGEKVTQRTIPKEQIEALNRAKSLD